MEILNESKVSLCPQGATSDETFRFFESIMMGAVPLVEAIPRLWFYETAPHFQNKWRDLDKTLSQILNFLQSSTCRDLLYDLADYSNNVLCPNNLAKHLKEKVLARRDNRTAHQQPLDEIRKHLKQTERDFK
jgi:hypothetical protein